VKAVVGVTGEVRPHHLGDRIVKACQRHMNGRPQFDDIAVVCFGRVDAGTATASSVAVPRLPEPPTGQISHS